MGLLGEGEEAAPGRGSGGSASFPQSIPQHPMSACGTWGLVAEGTRVACGWQGLASLIQLAGPPPSLRSSGPAGAELRAAVLCALSPCIWIQCLTLRHPPLWHLRLCPPHPLREKATLASPKKLGNCVAACAPVWPAECKGREQEGPWEGVDQQVPRVSVYLSSVTCRLCVGRFGLVLHLCRGDVSAAGCVCGHLCVHVCRRL